MNTYPYCGDYRLEPEDNSLEEGRFDSHLESSIEGFIESGHLPDLIDSGDVDEQLGDQWPEALHELSQAYDKGDKEALLELACKIAEARLEIAEEIIVESMQRQAKEAA